MVAVVLAVTTPACSHAVLVIDDFSTPQGPVSVIDEVSGGGIVAGARRFNPLFGSLEVGDGQAKPISEVVDLNPGEAEQSTTTLSYGSLDGSRDLNLDLSGSNLAFRLDIADLGTQTSFGTSLNLRVATAGGSFGSTAEAEISQSVHFVVP